MFLTSTALLEHATHEVQNIVNSCSELALTRNFFSLKACARQLSFTLSSVSTVCLCLTRLETLKTCVSVTNLISNFQIEII